MCPESDWNEYLEEIRSEVCAHCPERPPGGPPCAPLGKMCGVEMHLPMLVNAIRGVKSGMMEPYQDAIHEEVCLCCAMRGCEGCPCPMDYLSVLVVQAVELVGERHEQWDRLHARIHPSGGGQRVPIARLCAAYERATGTMIGCD